MHHRETRMAFKWMPPVWLLIIHTNGNNPKIPLGRWSDINASTPGTLVSYSLQREPLNTRFLCGCEWLNSLRCSCWLRCAEVSNLIPAPCVCLLGVYLMQVLSIVLSDFFPVETSSRLCKRPDPAADRGVYKSGNRQTVSGNVRK